MTQSKTISNKYLSQCTLDSPRSFRVSARDSFESRSSNNNIFSSTKYPIINLLWSFLFSESFPADKMKNNDSFINNTEVSLTISSNGIEQEDSKIEWELFSNKNEITERLGKEFALVIQSLVESRKSIDSKNPLVKKLAEQIIKQS